MKTMSKEQHEPGDKEQPKTKVSGFEGFISAKTAENLNLPEYINLKEWVDTSIDALPEMNVSPVDLTGKGGWSKEMSRNGEIAKVTSGFFNVIGVDVNTGLTKPDGSPIGWNQAAIVQNGSDISIPSRNVEYDLNASGFVGFLRDNEDRVLLSFCQEPLAKTKKHALLRTPFQTSAAKLKALLDGDEAKDPTLAKILNELGSGKNPTQLFNSGDIEVFPLPPADANRIDASNIGFIATIRDEGLHDRLTDGGKNRWCTRNEVKALIRSGLVNGHTSAAFPAI